MSPTIPVEPVTPQTGPPQGDTPLCLTVNTISRYPPPLEIPAQFQNQAEVSSEDEDRTPHHRRPRCWLIMVT